MSSENKTEKFKVGDKVRIIGMLYGHQFEIGEVVRIVKDNYGYTAASLAMPNVTWSVTDEEIESTDINKTMSDISEVKDVELGPKPDDSKALRFNSDKVEFDDIPLLAVTEIAKVGAYGREKYGKQNWRKSAPTSQYLNCTMRHLIKYMYGEEYDQESKCRHLSHAAWNIMALLEKIITKNDDDDRFEYPNKVNMEPIFSNKGE